MKQPDDYRQPEATFRDDEAAKAFIDRQEPHFRRQTVERSFETQSGYLVLIKQLGSRYALSFKRQIGTPPSSSIFLTADEAKRLGNMFGSNTRQHPDYQINAENFKDNIESLRTLGSARNNIVMPTILFLISLTLWIVLAISVIQTHYQGLH